jgi:transposase
LIKRQKIYLKLIQDRALEHAAADTQEDLRERGIIVIFWLPFFPDLNPIERVWHIMKNYIQDHFPEIISYDQLRLAVKEA